MTTPPPIPLIRQRDGTFKASLEDQIHDRMLPVEVRRDFRFWVSAFGYFAGTLLAGIGVLIGLLVVCGFAAVFWVLRRVKR